MEELKNLLNELESDGIYLDGFSRIRSSEKWYLCWTLRSCDIKEVDDDYNRTPRLVDIELRLDGKKSEMTMDWNQCSELKPDTVANIVKLANILKGLYI